MEQLPYQPPLMMASFKPNKLVDRKPGRTPGKAYLIVGTSSAGDRFRFVNDNNIFDSEGRQHFLFAGLVTNGGIIQIDDLNVIVGAKESKTIPASVKAALTRLEKKMDAKYVHETGTVIAGDGVHKIEELNV